MYLILNFCKGNICTRCSTNPGITGNLKCWFLPDITDGTWVRVFRSLGSCQIECSNRRVRSGSVKYSWGVLFNNRVDQCQILWTHCGSLTAKKRKSCSCQNISTNKLFCKKFSKRHLLHKARAFFWICVFDKRFRSEF